MASYANNSIIDYKDPIETYNFSLLSKALEYKQGKIDTFATQNQELINAYSSTDVVKDVDKQYLAGRIQGVVSALNSMQGADLSSQSTQNILQGHINSVVDNKVLNAVASTKNYRKLQSDIDYVKTKEIDKYNPLNEAFAMRGAQAWLNNPEAGAGFQGGTYTPYVDKNKAMLSIVKDLKETKGDQVIEVPVVDAQGNRRIQKKTIKGMTAEEIQAYLPNLIPSDVKQQLVIDGWGQYQGQGGQYAAKEVFDKFVQQRNGSIDKQIQTATIGETATGISKKQRQLYANQKQALIQEKSNFNSQIANVNTEDTASLGGFLETSRWMNNFAQIAGARESVEYDTDTAYYNQKDLELSYSRDARAERESQLGMIKTGLEIQKLQGELNPLTTGDVAMSATVSNPDQNIDPIADNFNEYQKLAGQVNGITSSVYNQANDQQKQLFDSEKQKAIQNGQTESNANKIAFDKIFKQSNPNEYNAIINAQNTKNIIASGLQKAKDTSLSEQFQDKNNKYFEGLTALQNSGYKDVDTFLKNNSITSDKLADPKTNIQLKRRAADLLSKYSKETKEVDLFNFAGRSEGETGLINFKYTVDKPLGFNLRTGIYYVDDPYEKSKPRQQEILQQAGFTGFISNSSANLLNEADRKIVKNSLPQGAGAFDFDEKSPMTIVKNTDGSFSVTQVKETTKDGEIIPQTRSANIATNSSLYNYISGKVSPEVERQVRLDGNVPTTKATASYLNDNESFTVRENSDFLLNKVGNEVLNASGSSPINYLTAGNTKKVYTARLGNLIPTQKINTLVNLMDQNSDKLEVKVDVKKGQYEISTFLRGVNDLLLSQDAGGDSTDKVNLYTKQYPQITAGEAMFKYLQNNPEQIDNVIDLLQD